MKIVALLGLIVIGGVVFLLYEIHDTHRTLAAASSTPREEDAPPAPHVTPSSSPAPSPTVNPAALPSVTASPSGRLAPSAPVAQVATPFANPEFANDPELRKAVTLPQAVEAAQHGADPLERRNAIGWLMSQGGAEQYPLLVGLKSSDPDPQVRTSASVAASVLRSRFPRVIRQDQ